MTKGIIIILIIIIIVLALLNVRKESNQKQEDNRIDIKMPYKKKYLLTKNEWVFYKKIKPICDKNNLHIISKVRLADLVEVKKELDNKERQRYFNKIKNKHIDFVLCNPENLAIVALVELDDKTHEKAERRERDEFINKLCDTVGYTIIRGHQSDDFETLLNEKNIINKDLSQVTP